MKIEFIKANDRWYVCRDRQILSLFKNAEDALEFVRLYKGYIRRYSLSNQLKEVWKWITLIFCWWH